MKRRLTTRKLLAATVGIAALVGAPRQARAQYIYSPGFDVERFEPAGRGSDWLSGESLDYRGHLRPAFGLVGDYSYRGLTVLTPAGHVQSSVVRNAFFLHPGASLVLFDRFRVGFDLPVEAATDGHAGLVPRNGVTTIMTPPVGKAALGDLRFDADARLFGKYGDPVTIAAGLQIWAPTGAPGEYAGDDKPRLRPRVLVAGDVGMFAYSGQVGFMYRPLATRIGVGAVGNEIDIGLGAGVRLLEKKLLVGPELWGGTVLEEPFGNKTAPIEVALGAHYSILPTLRASAGASTGLTRSYGSPVSRVMLGIEWVAAAVEDRDQDGVSDPDDACPDEKGVRSAEPSRNGCPPPPPPPPPPAPPSDRDKDGIPDTADACPDTPGQKSDDPRTNGCKDSDGDGIADPIDACPDENGVKSADPKANGCADDDADGIADKDDACPTIPGKPDPDKTKNGCPANFDRDHDGINNNVDACPDDPGKPDPDPLKNGCPTAFVSAGQIKTLLPVQFKERTAKLETLPWNLSTLEAIAKVLREHPEIKRLRIEGHTDNTGSAQANKKLGADRAGAVVKWLVTAGIAQGRLKGVGVGAERPLDTNDTEQGRQANSRVELHIE